MKSYWRWSDAGEKGRSILTFGGVVLASKDEKGRWCKGAVPNSKVLSKA